MFDGIAAYYYLTLAVKAFNIMKAVIINTDIADTRTEAWSL